MPLLFEMLRFFSLMMLYLILRCFHCRFRRRYFLHWPLMMNAASRYYAFVIAAITLMLRQLLPCRRYAALLISLFSMPDVAAMPPRRAAGSSAADAAVIIFFFPPAIFFAAYYFAFSLLIFRAVSMPLSLLCCHAAAEFR